MTRFLLDAAHHLVKAHRGKLSNMAHSYCHGMIMEEDESPNSNVVSSVAVNPVEEAAAKKDKEAYTNNDCVDQIIKSIEGYVESYPEKSEQFEKTEKAQRDKDCRRVTPWK